MKKRLTILVLATALAAILGGFLYWSEADAGPNSPCYWSGTFVRCLPTGGIRVDDARTLRWYEGVAGGSNYAAVKAPATLAGDYTLTLPADDGNSAEVLATNGTGTLSWVARASVPAAGAVYSDGSALLSETALDPQRGGTGVANNTAATLTRSGNHALTLTTTNTTGVTLPTTGTLATLAGAESLTNKKLGSLTTNGPIYTSAGDGTLNSEANLSVARGGSGAGTFTANGILYGNGTSAFGVTGAGVTNQVLHANTGTTPTYGLVESGDILDGTIVNIDINAAAAIAGSKIVTATASVAGVVDTGTQTFGGVKTFTGTASITAPSMTLLGSVLSLGADNTPAASRTNNVIKEARITVPSYANANAEMLAVRGKTDTATNNLIFGGSSGSYTAATELHFYTNASGVADLSGGTDRLSINSAGQVSAPTATNATSATTGAITTTGGISAAQQIWSDTTVVGKTGVKFKDTGSGSDTMTYYAENVTWTPTLAFSGGNGTGALSGTVAKYMRIGSMVIATMETTVTKGTAAGNLIFGGLPFTANASSLTQNGVVRTDAVATLLNKFIVGSVGAGSTTIAVNYSGSTYAAVPAADLGAAVLFQINVTYWM